MITISTTTEAEARDMHAVMSSAPPDLDYGVYLLGREVARRAGGIKTTDLRFASASLGQRSEGGG